MGPNPVKIVSYLIGALYSPPLKPQILSSQKHWGCEAEAVIAEHWKMFALFTLLKENESEVIERFDRWCSLDGFKGLHGRNRRCLRIRFSIWNRVFWRPSLEVLMPFFLKSWDKIQTKKQGPSENCSQSSHGLLNTQE